MWKINFNVRCWVALYNETYRLFLCTQRRLYSEGFRHKTIKNSFVVLTGTLSRVDFPLPSGRISLMVFIHLSRRLSAISLPLASRNLTEAEYETNKHLKNKRRTDTVACKRTRLFGIFPHKMAILKRALQTLKVLPHSWPPNSKQRDIRAFQTGTTLPFTPNVLLGVAECYNVKDSLSWIFTVSYLYKHKYFFFTFCRLVTL